jgi:hypothetical protein
MADLAKREDSNQQLQQSIHLRDNYTLAFFSKFLVH